MAERGAAHFAFMDEDNTVYRNLKGPTEFHVIGTMKDWTIEDRLHFVIAPTLVISGRHGKATRSSCAPMSRKCLDADGYSLSNRATCLMSRRRSSAPLRLGAAAHRFPSVEGVPRPLIHALGAPAHPSATCNLHGIPPLRLLAAASFCGEKTVRRRDGVRRTRRYSIQRSA
jgi:hypothetical protein